MQSNALSPQGGSVFRRRVLYLLVLASGFASLSWEVIWQIKSTLALGVSAWGTAVTIAVTMGGMSLGALLMGRSLRTGAAVRPLWMYGALEFVVAMAGVFLNPAFRVVEKLDTWVYSGLPGTAPLVHILAIAVVLGIPALCMGATLPVFGLLAEDFQVSIAILYGLNTLGAASGSLFVALLLIPFLGITSAIWTIAGINVAVCLVAWVLPSSQAKAVVPTAPMPEVAEPGAVPMRDLFIVFVTGFATFTLEIAWFRSYAATFHDNADVFAIMLACLLLVLGVASRIAPELKRRNKPLGTILCLSGIFVLLFTPIIERIDIFCLMLYGELLGPLTRTSGLIDPNTFTANWDATWLYLSHKLVAFFLIFGTLAVPMGFLGVAFPWLLDSYRSPRKLGILYSMNTVGAILGALLAAWVLLPTIGFARAAWVAGALVIVAGLWITPPAKRFWWGWGVIAMVGAVLFESGIGSRRVQGYYGIMEGVPAMVLKSYEGPEATVSVVQYSGGGRRIIIDSSSASGQSGERDKLGESYMLWMGHLPMLLHPHPKNALVICFGTGQTANAVRKENPESLDIVDINPRIYKLAPYFTANEGVLYDPRVNAIVMDGRAYLRRTKKSYDVITLEPMPPTTVGVNALYCKEFYELAREKLGPEGVIAQWLPLQCVAPRYSASIARTFAEVFPNSVLWMDPDTQCNGILLGTRDNKLKLGKAWPGFGRSGIIRPPLINEEAVRQNLMLDSNQVHLYAKYGQTVSDDNQLLGYGRSLVSCIGLVRENLQLLKCANDKVVVP